MAYLKYFISIVYILQSSTIINIVAVTYPTKIKDVVSKLTQITQTALQNRHSRMEIELPPTAEYGIEATKSNDLLSMPDKIKKSNREAARLFTDMFSSISSTITVLFPSENEASTARSLWSGNNKGALYRGKVLSIDSPAPKGYSKLRSRKFSFEEQQAALLGSDGVYIPEDTEVLIIAGPRTKDYNKIKKITNKLTDATLIILLNARAATAAADGEEVSTSLDDKPSTATEVVVQPNNNIMNATTSIPNANFYKWVNENYVSVYNYAPPILPLSDTKTQSNPSLIDTKKEYLLYHEYNQKWFLAFKEDKSTSGGIAAAGGFLEGLTASLTGGGGGGFKTIWESTTDIQRPSPPQILKLINSLPHSSVQQ